MRLPIVLALLLSCGGEPEELAIEQDSIAPDVGGARSLLLNTVIPELEASSAYRSTAPGNPARMAIVRTSIDRAIALLSLAPPDAKRATEILATVSIPILASTPGYQKVYRANPNAFFDTRLGHARRGLADAIARLQSQTNVARGRSASASSNWSSAYDATKAVDGDTATGWSASASDQSAWLEIDLGAPHLLRRLRLVTRAELDQPVTRKNFQIWASNDPDMSHGHVVLGSVGAAGIAFGGTYALEIANPTPYRYLAVVKTAPEYFFISELRVFGAKVESSGGPGGAEATQQLDRAITNLEASTVFARADGDNVVRMQLVRDTLRLAINLIASAETGLAVSVLRAIIPVFEASAGYRIVLSGNPNNFARTKIGIARKAIDDAITALTTAAVWQKAGTMLWHADGFPTEIKGPVLRDNRIGWVAIQVHDGTSPMDPNTLSRLQAGWIDQLRAFGLSVGAWGVNRTDPEGEAHFAASLIRQWGFDFYIADAEIEYKYTQGDGSWSPEAYGRSQRFVNAFRAELPNLPAAISSYGRTDLADIDWAAWRNAGFDWLPQAYWNDYEIYRPSLCIEAAVASGWPRARVHPTIGIWGGGVTGYVSGDAYVADLAGTGIVGFSVYLGETVGDADWAALRRGVEGGLARIPTK